MPEKDLYTVERFVVYGLISFVVLLFCAALIIDDLKQQEHERYKLEKFKNER